MEAKLEDISWYFGVCTVMMYSVQVNGLHFVILTYGIFKQYEKLYSHVSLSEFLQVSHGEQEPVL